MENVSGSTIKDYKLLAQIWSSRLSAGYIARKAEFEHDVVLKIINPRYANDPNFIRHFEFTARSVARLEYIHIVPIYDCWRDPSGAFLVMRWLKGGSLKEKLEDGRFNLESVALLLEQVAAGLNFAHKNKVFYGYLQPSNILFDEEGNAFVDLSAASFLSKALITQSHLDTDEHLNHYQPPEYFHSGEPTPQVDVYSLAVIIYEASVGEPLNSTDMARALPLLKTVYEPDVEYKIRMVLEKATAEDPEHRYASTLEFEAAFRKAGNLEHSRGMSILELLTKLLTPREQETLKLVAKDLTNQEIADKLGVQKESVRDYVNSLYKKLNKMFVVETRRQLTMHAKELTSLVAEKPEAHILPSRVLLEANPYKGLKAFDTPDEHIFFGREALTDRLIKRLGEPHKLSRFLAIIGPSGSGKTSLVKAGLIPALWRGQLPGSNTWQIITITPGANPLTELKVALNSKSSGQLDDFETLLKADASGLVQAANLILPEDGSELVVVIDQFEEVFTRVENEETRVRFLNILHEAVINPSSRVRIIITLRADFYDKPLHYPGIADLISKRMETLVPLSEDELERVIVYPAQRAGYKFEPDLVATMMKDATSQPNALPLLEFTLTELFERHQDGVLVYEAYEAIGGLAGSITRLANDACGQVRVEYGEEGLNLVRQIFLKLVTTLDGDSKAGQIHSYSRRRAFRSELKEFCGDSNLVDYIINTFVFYRLLSLDRDPASRKPVLEITHEALIYEWPLLIGWLQEYGERMLFWNRLNHSANLWHTNGYDPSYLYTGKRLKEAIQLVNTYADLQLNPFQRQFLEASQDTVERRRLFQHFVRQEVRSADILSGVSGVVSHGIVAFLFLRLRDDIAPIQGILVIATAVLGVFVGAVYVTGFDWVKDQVRTSSPLLKWMLSIAVGILAFSISILIIHLTVKFNFLRIVLLGVPWGATAGIGRLWVLGEERAYWRSIPVVSIACGLVLWASNFLSQVSTPEFTSISFMIGFIVPFSILTAATLPELVIRRRRKNARS